MVNSGKKWSTSHDSKDCWEWRIMFLPFFKIQLNVAMNQNCSMRVPNDKKLILLAFIQDCI